MRESLLQAKEYTDIRNKLGNEVKFKESLPTNPKLGEALDTDMVSPQQRFIKQPRSNEEGI
jgi:hypothetical protein